MFMFMITWFVYNWIFSEIYLGMISLLSSLSLSMCLCVWQPVYIPLILLNFRILLINTALIFMIIYAPFLSNVDCLRTMLTFNLQKKMGNNSLFFFSDQISLCDFRVNTSMEFFFLYHKQHLTYILIQTKFSSSLPALWKRFVLLSYY